MKKILSLCTYSLLMIGLLACIGGAITITSHADSNWALVDLVFAKNAILENHPGVYNELDPEFCKSINTFFENAQEKLHDVHDEDTCRQVLRGFGRAFNDIHMSINFPSQVPSSAQESKTAVPKSLFSRATSETISWFRIPSFSPRGDEIEDMRSIIDSMPTMRNVPCIVFDVRGNGGGSSLWGKQIADALFGAGYTQSKRAQILEQQYVEWRASAANIAYMNTDVKAYVDSNFGAESKTAIVLDGIIQGMQKALERGDMLFCDRSSTLDDIEDVSPHGSLCASSIVVIVDDRCASACLDFIDELKQMGTRVLLVGKTTLADSLYMECRTIPLLSGKGFMRIPIKVYRNRPRGHNIPHIPDIAYARDLADTQAVYQGGHLSYYPLPSNRYG